MRKFYKSPEVEILSLVSKDVFALDSTLVPQNDGPLEGETGSESSEF